MVKHIVIVSDRSRDDISVYTEEPAFLVLADRKDLPYLRDLQEANRAGIYILMGENTRYVGQASNSIFTRLSQHDKDKEWWTKVIFFGREDGHLDKSQTDYLEAKLIAEFQNSSLTLANATVGNSSWIDKTSKINADNVWFIAQSILSDVVNLNIFEEELMEENQTFVDGRVHASSISLSDGKFISDKNPTQAYTSLFRYLLTDERYREEVLETVVTGRPSMRYLLGTEPIYSKRGGADTAEVQPGIFLLKRMSSAEKMRVTRRFLEQLDLIATFNW